MSREKKNEDILTHIQMSALLFSSFPPNGIENYKKALKTSIIPLREELKMGKNQKLLVATLFKIKNSFLNKEQNSTFINLLFKKWESNHVESKKWEPAHFQLVLDLLAFIHNR